MTELTETKEETTIQTDAPPVEKASATPDTPAVNTEEKEKKSFGGNREFKKNRRPSRGGNSAPRSEFNQKILAIRRVTRVSSGGRRFSFSVAMAIGNGKGKIGVGTGKATDTSLAIEKAVKDAKKNLIDVKTTTDMSIPHLVEAKFSSAMVKIQPSPGKGLVAGSAIRDLVELGGLKDIVGKVMSGSKNKLNIAKATIKAFETLSNPKNQVASDKKLKTKN